MTFPGTYGFRLSPNSTASYGIVYGAQASAFEFRTNNPVLPLGYIGFESDTGRLKIGDGVSDWNTLPYLFFPLNSEQRSTTGVDTTDDIIIDDSDHGLVLKDDASPAHYWRITISAAGSPVITDLGTTKP
jgi:hypothetical protein